MTKKILQYVINNGLKTKMKLLYGGNSRIVVEDVYWSRRNKNWNVSVVVYTDTINESVEVHPYGVELLVEMSFKLLKIETKLVRVTSSLKYEKNGTSDTTL